MKEKKVKKKRNKKSKNKKKTVSRIVLFIVGIIVFGSGIVGYFYVASTINPGLKSVYEIIPLSVAKIENSESISSKQLFQDTAAVKKFYESKDYAHRGERVDFSTKAGKIRMRIKEKDVLNKLIEDKIIQRIAESKGIKISAQDINKAIEKSLTTSNSDYQKLATNLNSNYGWTIKQFKNKVVKNQLYLNKLFKWYKNNLQNSSDYKRAQKAKASISAEGGNFDEIVHKFSDGESAEQDGRIAWIEEVNIIPEVADTLASMEEGQISDVIISPLGMHIVMLEKRREVKDKDGIIKRELQLKQVFIKGKSFVNWVQEQKKQIKVEIFLKEYQWDENIGEVEFSDLKFQEVVKKIKAKSQGDPSL